MKKTKQTRTENLLDNAIKRGASMIEEVRLGGGDHALIILTSILIFKRVQGKEKIDWLYQQLVVVVVKLQFTL